MFTSQDSENTSCVVEFGANAICLLKVLIRVYCGYCGSGLFLSGRIMVRSTCSLVVKYATDKTIH